MSTPDAARAGRALGALLDALLDALIDATGEPNADADAGCVVEEAAALARRRAPLVEELRAALGDGAVPGDLAPRLHALRARDDRWAAALARARHVLAERLVAVRGHRRRGYAR